MLLPEIGDELTKLHATASKLLTDARHTRPSLRLVFFRVPLERLEDLLDALGLQFVGLDGELIRHATAPTDVTTALRNSAQFNFYTAKRDSVRGLLADISASVDALRNRLDFLGTLALSLLGLIVAVVALAVAFRALFV